MNVYEVTIIENNGKCVLTVKKEDSTNQRFSLRPQREYATRTAALKAALESIGTIDNQKIVSVVLGPLGHDRMGSNLWVITESAKK